MEFRRTGLFGDAMSVQLPHDYADVRYVTDVYYGNVHDDGNFFSAMSLQYLQAGPLSWASPSLAQGVRCCYRRFIPA